MHLSVDQSARVRSVSIVAVLAVLAAMLPITVLSTPAQAAGNGNITLRLVNARSVSTLVEGDPLPANKKFTWLITIDDTGDPLQPKADCVPAPVGNNPDPLRDQGGQSHCQWPSIRTTPGNVPVYTSGNQSDFAGPLNLPNGNYLISVLADGYALGGAHFTVAGNDQQVKVPLQPYPLPLGTMKIQVFHDNAPVDATYEVDGEQTAGMTGFVAHLTDVLGEVTTDWFGNPLCTNYEKDGQGRVVFSNGDPVINAASPGGKCVSDANGLITIPNLGSNRYGVSLAKPADKQSWIQTTTLEGGHDHDVWVMPGDTGLDSELVIAGEPVPWVQFGYIEPKGISGGTASVTGQVLAGLTYVGGNNGISIPGGTGTAGGKEGDPIDRPWVALSDLNNGDQMVYMGRGNKDGTFSISGVPAGSYQLTMWDDLQDYIIYSTNVTVADGQQVDVAKQYLSGWMARIYGTVFIDTNGNGKRDSGERGYPGTALTLRERDNSLMDQMQNTVTTNDSGNYAFSESYPLTKWVVLENFNTRFQTTGITVQAENDPNEHTYLGSAVDMNVLPVLGLGGRVDWGVKPYARGTNGGIVGTVTYDTTRNELDPTYAVTESYQPGIPGVAVHLYPIKKDLDPNSPTYLDPILVNGHEVADKDHELTSAYTSESWAPSKDCVAQQWDGSPLNLPALAGAGATCIESPADGWVGMPADNTPDNFGQTVNGNYGFGSSDVNLYPPGDPDNPAPNHDLPLYADLAANNYPAQTLVPDDYVVTVDLPMDATGNKPIYQVTREQDVNVFSGDNYLPQENLVNYNGPAGSDSAGAQTTPLDPPTAPTSQGGGLQVFPCVGADQTVHVTDPAFAAGGGSPFESQARPLCDEKLVTVHNQQAVAPNFNLFTETPLPTHFWGLTINDLGLSWDPTSIQYGEAQGLPHVPMGIYDFSGTLVDSTITDANGFYEAIEPSTSSYNCPLPAGPCPGMYRFVGNDPGQPGRPNPNFNPRFRTISANFQAWPGLFTVTDTAPTQTGAVIVTPGTTSPQPVNCKVSDATPSIVSVSKVTFPAGGRNVTIYGSGFGTQNPNSRLDLIRPNGTVFDSRVNLNSWGNGAISFHIEDNAGFGPLQVHIRNGQSGLWSSNAITLHNIGSGGGVTYQPTVRTVPGDYSTIQAAINDAPVNAGANAQPRLIVVRPGQASSFNPDGAYFENLVVNRRVKLQGFGPGGVDAGGTRRAGSIIDGQAFNPDGATGTAWFNLVNGSPHAGPAGVPDGAAVTVLPRNNGQFASNAVNYASIDGFKVTGGYQQDVAGNLNAISGANVTGFGAPGATVTQGGGVYVHGAATNLRVTNDVIIGNSGSYAGGVRVGTPYVDNNTNANVRISYNTIRDNGGTNLAGGVGLFDGSNAYSVDHNDICGNFSSEYGGGVSHFGLSPNGSIANNRVWFNESYDEAGGIMVAGELPSNPDNLGNGSGAVTVTANEIVANNANDDGGGLRLLQVNDFPITITNNIIADNLSTHEGGGVALDDASHVVFANNTVARNITSATAVTSNGQPAPAGLSTARNSVQLQAAIGGGRDGFSNPALFNNVFWQNMAGTWNGTTVTGVNLPGDANPANIWDVGAADGSGVLNPSNSVLTLPNAGQATGNAATVPGTSIPTAPSPTGNPYNDVLVSGNPSDLGGLNFVAPFSIGVDVSTLRTFPGFRQAVIISRNQALDQLGNYHVNNGSIAVNLGIPTFTTTTVPFAPSVAAPTTDIDGNVRYTAPPPPNTRIEAGADERP